MMNSRLLFLMILFFTLASCGDDDEVCQDTAIQTTSLEETYGCTDTKINLEIDLSNNYTVISNQAEFDERVTGECKPEIDFTTYDLIIGKEMLPSGNDSIDYQYIENCRANTFILIVTFNQNETLIAPDLTYHRLVPKIRGDAVVDVEIELN